MPDLNPLPPQSERTAAPAAALAGTAAYWLFLDDDLALGCECADPALQIERWGQEALPLLDHSA